MQLMITRLVSLNLLSVIAHVENVSCIQSLFRVRVRVRVRVWFRMISCLRFRAQGESFANFVKSFN